MNGSGGSGIKEAISAPNPVAGSFLHDVYDSRGDTPLQRKIRYQKPLPVGVVLIQQSRMGESEMREALRAIRGAGFGNLKQFHFMSRTPLVLADAERIALDEGVIPYWYGIGGGQEITPELCRLLDIPEVLALPEVQAHPAMIAYQTDILRLRAARRAAKGSPPSTAGGMGEPSRLPCAVPTRQAAAFAAWLQRQYTTVSACRYVYKLADADPEAADWESLAAPFVTDSDSSPAGAGWTDFRRVRDVLRFQADRHFEGIRETAAWHAAWDPNEPVRTGCHLIFENQAASGWDFELQAAAIKEYGSFYASFHPAHHLTEVGGELDIPCYLTSRLVCDFSKGGWPALWESVGGPSEYSGTHPFGADGNRMTRCFLSYLAAGIKGIGIWSWNVRDWGWEIGEYALTNLQGRTTSRSEAAGAVARACEKWRWELWEARDEPLVGVLYSWENDAAFARLGLGAYGTNRQAGYPVRPSEARIGAGRALVNGNIPFEFVTERDLAAGLAARYGTILVPHTLCLTRATLSALLAYAESGGHVVIDAPTLLLRADDGTLFDTRAGSDFERLFGFEHADVQDTFRRPTYLNGTAVTGQTFDVNVTSAQIAANYDGSDRPAILKNDVGRGMATALTWEATRMCHVPGNEVMERIVQRATLPVGVTAAPWDSGSDVLLTYRRVAPDADHYFIVNPSPQEQSAALTVGDRRSTPYVSGEDCLSGEGLDIRADGVDFLVPAEGARWIRLARQRNATEGKAPV